MSVEQKIQEMLEKAKEINESVEDLVLTEEDLDLLTQEEISELVENMDQLDEVSQATLASYVGKQQMNKEADNSGEGTRKVRAKLENGEKKTFLEPPKTGSAINDTVIGDASSRSAGDNTKVRNEDIDLGNLFDGEDLSEEFKAKATTIFEAAVAARVAAEVAKIEEGIAQQALEESAELKEGLIDKVDGYLGYVAENWMNKNELALERGIKADLFESFMSSMKQVFAEHYVNVPEEQLDVLEAANARIEELEEGFNAVTADNIAMTSILKDISKQTQIEEASEGLNEVDAEKFKTLAEAIVYEDEETFEGKLVHIKETYFKKSPVKESSVTFITDTPVLLEEKEQSSELSKEMNQYVRSIR